MHQWDRYRDPQKVFLLGIKHHIDIHYDQQCELWRASHWLRCGGSCGRRTSTTWHYTTLCAASLHAHTCRVRLTVHGRTNYHRGVAAVVADQCFTCRIHALLCTYTESFCFSVAVRWTVVNLVIPYRPGSAPTAMPSSLNSCPTSSIWPSTNARSWFQHLRRAQSWPSDRVTPWSSVQYWLRSKHTTRHIPQMEVRLMLTLLKMGRWATRRHIRAQPDPMKGVCQSWLSQTMSSPHRLKPENERCSTTTSYVVPCCSPKSVTPKPPSLGWRIFRPVQQCTTIPVRWTHAGGQAIGSSRQRLWPWMDNDCFRLYCHSKRLEKCYRKSSSAADCLEWVQQQT